MSLHVVTGIVTSTEIETDTLASLCIVGLAHTTAPSNLPNMDLSAVNFRQWPELESQKWSLGSSSKRLSATPSLPYIRTVDRWRKELDADWLEFEVDGRIVVKLSCTVCKRFSAQIIGPYITGTKNVKKGSVIFHMRSDAHQQAMKAKQSCMGSSSHQNMY